MYEEIFFHLPKDIEIEIFDVVVCKNMLGCLENCITFLERE